MALTDTTIRSLRPEGGKRELLLSDVGGLHIRVRAGTTGKITRTWQFRRRDGGGLTVKTIGVYPTLSLKEARLKAAALALERAETKGPTVEEAADQWFEEIISKAHKSAAKTRRYLDLAVGDLGNMRVADVEPKHIAKVVRDYRDRAAKNKRARSGGRTVARMLLATLKGLFNYAVGVGWIAASPAAAITGAALGAPDKARSRVLSDDEIRWVMKDSSPQGTVWRFLLATGLRLGEVYAGYRNGPYWVVPAAASKNGKEHRVWLSPLALKQREVQPWPPRWNCQAALSMQRIGWSCHDLRRTFATRLNDMGVAPHIVETMLNHSLGGVLATYNRAEYLTERQQALEAWAIALLALVDPEAADGGENRHVAEVVPLRPTAA